MLLSKTASKSLIEFSPISSRVIVARFHGQGHDIPIVQSYAPTSDHGDDEVYEFQATIQEALDKAEKRDIKIVMGDFNAKVGKDFATWSGILGHHGYGDENGRGERLLQFCQMNKMSIMKTRFQHKKTQKWTWEAPEKSTCQAPDSRKKKVVSARNMIDFMMIDQRWRSAITDTRSFPSASIGSDHSLVLGNIRIRFQAQVNKAARPRIDIDKLIKNHLVRENYQLALKNRIEQLEIVNNNILEAARETIGNRRSYHGLVMRYLP